MRPKRYELNDEEWARIADLLPGKSTDPGRTRWDNRLFAKGVLWVLRSGAHGHDLPERYGKWKCVHKGFTRWAKACVWERVFDKLKADMKNEYVMLDATLVRAHQQAATGKGGTKRGRRRLGSGAFPRCSYDEDPSSHRRARQAASLCADRRPGP